MRAPGRLGTSLLASRSAISGANAGQLHGRGLHSTPVQRLDMLA
jgi:hypothetical protein